MSNSGQINSTRDYSKTVTIEVGQSESDAIEISGTNLVGLIVPSNLTATYINFLVSDSLAGTYKILKTNDPKTSSTAPVEFNVGLNVSDAAFGFKPEDLAAWEFLKIKSVDVSDVADNQLSVNGVIQLVLRPIN